jgi:hypothetical protein
MAQSVDADRGLQSGCLGCAGECAERVPRIEVPAEFGREDKIMILVCVACRPLLESLALAVRDQHRRYGC